MLSIGTRPWSASWTSRLEQVDPSDAGVSSPARGALESRWPTVFALLTFCLLFGARALTILGLSGPITTDDLYQVALTAAIFVVPILFVFTGTRRLMIRFRWPVLAAQSVLTWLPFALFGSAWEVGIAGLFAGLVLVCFSGWGPWLAAACILVTDVALRTAVTGLPWAPTWSGVLWVVNAFVDDGIVVFGIIRFTQLIEDLQMMRGQAAELGIEAERLRAAETLDAAVYAGVDDVATKVATAERLYSCDPPQASAAIRSAGVVARQTSARARKLFADHGYPEPTPEMEGSVPESKLGARLAWGVLVVILCGYATAGINDSYTDHVGGRLLAVLAVGAVCFIALQLYHSWLALQDRRSSMWPLTLALQAAIAYAFFLPPISSDFTLIPFLAGSVLLLAPERLKLVGFVAVVASWAALTSLVPVNGEPPSYRGALIILYIATEVVYAGLLVYGLARLVDTARQLGTVRAGLTRAAATVERLRLARDVHDLLGLGLSALALKADLIEQLITRRDPQAAVEIQLMGRICATARADVRQVTAGNQRSTLEAEVAVASDILSSAGIEVRITVPSWPLGTTIDDVLVPVLRESVTNVLRHSAATLCSIEIHTQIDIVRLAVGNNGVVNKRRRAGGNGDQPDVVPGRGLGLRNLRSRVEGAGGEMQTRQLSDYFKLIADIPVGPFADEASA